MWTPGMIRHPVTLSWHRTDKLRNCPIFIKAALPLHFYYHGMSRPGIDPGSPFLEPKLYRIHYQVPSYISGRIDSMSLAIQYIWGFRSWVAVKRLVTWSKFSKILWAHIRAYYGIIITFTIFAYNLGSGPYIHAQNDVNGSNHSKLLAHFYEIDSGVRSSHTKNSFKMADKVSSTWYANKVKFTRVSRF